MEPNIWGPGAWLFLHSITLNYPDNPTLEHKKIYSDFFNRLKDVLPCEICKKHYGKNIKDSPINFSLNSKEAITKWLVNIHNKVNLLNGKELYNYNTFIDDYSNLYNENHLNKYFLFILLIIIVLLIIRIYQ